ncbi:recombination mediator RecR [Patescibacteria group bacterium]
MKIPRAITRLIDSFQSLPGVGPKTAQRLTFHLLHFPQEYLDNFSKSLLELKNKTKLCSICKNISENDECSVCDDTSRDLEIIIVVAHPLDTFALEKTGFKGLYHVLHGLIDPLNSVGPEELFISGLMDRLNGQTEIILATNSSMEGESTAMYIAKQVKEKQPEVRITRIARGLPVGGDIEYADDITLSRALEGRKDFQI